MRLIKVRRVEDFEEAVVTRPLSKTFDPLLIKELATRLPLELFAKAEPPKNDG